MPVDPDRLRNWKATRNRRIVSEALAGRLGLRPKWVDTVLKEVLADVELKICKQRMGEGARLATAYNTNERG
jgi:hypothetical protein